MVDREELVRVQRVGEPSRFIDLVAEAEVIKELSQPSFFQGQLEEKRQLEGTLCEICGENPAVRRNGKYGLGVCDHCRRALLDYEDDQKLKRERKVNREITIGFVCAAVLIVAAFFTLGVLYHNDSIPPVPCVACSDRTEGQR